MNPRAWLGLLYVAAVFGPMRSLAASAPVRPNILWLIIEDVGNDFGCHGEPGARTPNIDQFAREGRTYRNAFATAPVCSPSRSAFMTGHYQTSFGAQHHRSHRSDGFRRPADVRLITERLREAGYFTANLKALGPEAGFRGTGKTDWNFADDGKAFDSDKWSDLKPHQPFYAQLNLHETHRPYERAKVNPTDAARVRLPPYLADDPIIREDWAAYLDEIAVADQHIGVVLRLLERDGLRDNTVVFVFGDNGREDFRGKYFATEQGFLIPLIVRWPALLPAGTTSDELVSLLDVHVQSLALAGLHVSGLDGAPFFGPEAKRREFIFGARDRIDETPDRVRTVRDARFKLVRNFEPQRPYLQEMPYAEVTNPTYRRMRELFAAGRLNPDEARFMAPSRPPEELYDLQTDPFELNNLADDLRYRAQRDRLRVVLDRWIKETHDAGAQPEDPAEARKEIDNPQRRESTERLRKQLGLPEQKASAKE